MTKLAAKQTDRRLRTSALLIGYAMSRLDTQYLALRGLTSWQSAYKEASTALGVQPASLKNLRDEFDPFHSNGRAGWRSRAIRPDRQRILDEMTAVGGEALAALVDRLIAGDEDATNEAIDSLSVTNRIAHNVAERLLTGRLAEEFFLTHSKSLVGLEAEALRDRRDNACGYDFGVKSDPSMAIEVKGMKGLKGAIQFTDREWIEAGVRTSKYLVVVVGNLARSPKANIIADPCASLKATCRYRASLTATWEARIGLA